MPPKKKQKLSPKSNATLAAIKLAKRVADEYEREDEYKQQRSIAKMHKKLMKEEAKKKKAEAFSVIPMHFWASVAEIAGPVTHKSLALSIPGYNKYIKGNPALRAKMSDDLQKIANEVKAGRMSLRKANDFVQELFQNETLKFGGKTLHKKYYKNAALIYDYNGGTGFQVHIFRTCADVQRYLIKKEATKSIVIYEEIPDADYCRECANPYGLKCPK